MACMIGLKSLDILYVPSKGRSVAPSYTNNIIIIIMQWGWIIPSTVGEDCMTHACTIVNFSTTGTAIGLMLPILP